MKMGNFFFKSKASPVSPAEIEAFVTKAITTHPVVIFSKTYCPSCVSAKSDIAGVGKSVANFAGAQVCEMDTMGAKGAAIQAHLAQRTGRRTVPNVFIGGQPVGGGDDISAFKRRGVLAQMITQAPEQLAHNKQQAADDDVAKAAPSTGEETVKQRVDTLIETEKVLMFSKTTCPFCVQAKDILSEAGRDVPGYTGPTVFELNEMGPAGPEMQRYLMERTGQRTVPNIFINGAHIGGCDHLMSIARDNRLKTALTSALSAPANEAPADAPADAPAAVPAAVPAEAPAETTAEVGTVAARDVGPLTPSFAVAVFGAGCFWGVELAFQRVMGVTRTEVGYSNGKSDRVTYEDVCAGDSGAAEVVRVTYDPTVVPLEKLLEMWGGRHDPTSLNQQGNDVGTQYRSALFYAEEAQKDIFEKWVADTETKLGAKVVTDVAEVNNYCEAEEYHQRYLEKKGQSAAKGDTEDIRCYG